MAWVTSSDGQGHGRHWQALDLKKVRKAVVGTAFAQTEPYALTELNNRDERLRLMINTTGTFHPKVILGTKGKLCRAIVGSANLTTAAFTKNTELSMLMKGDSNEQVFKDIQNFIQDQFDQGKKLDKDWLDNEYTPIWKKAKRTQSHVPRSPLEAISLVDLNMSWDQYVAVIFDQQGRITKGGHTIRIDDTGNSYKVELDNARDVFDKMPNFAEINGQGHESKRNLMLGFGTLSGGQLGNMNANREGKKIIRKTPGKIGKSLDRLPLKDPVSLTLANKLLGELTELPGIKIATASRLFALKRPDLFVSVNTGCMATLAPLLGVKKITTVKQYIKLLEALWNTEWHKAKRPQRNRPKRELWLWNHRAALLDAAIFDV
jgi:hypothetical protein